MMTLLDWSEQAGLENLRSRLHNADVLANESHLTFSVLFAGLAASLGYTLKLAETEATPSFLGAEALTAYLMLLCIFLIVKCLRISDIPAPTNEPRNLYQKNIPFEALRAAELENIQERIDVATRRNISTSNWLNGIRLMGVLTPVVFLAALYLCRGLALGG